METLSGMWAPPAPHVAFPVFEPVSAVLVQGAPVALVLADEGSPALVQLVPPMGTFLHYFSEYLRHFCRISSVGAPVPLQLLAHGALVCLPAFITFQVELAATIMWNPTL